MVGQLAEVRRFLARFDKRGSLPEAAEHQMDLGVPGLAKLLEQTQAVN